MIQSNKNRYGIISDHRKESIKDGDISPQAESARMSDVGIFLLIDTAGIISHDDRLLSDRIYLFVLFVNSILKILIY